MLKKKVKEYLLLNISSSVAVDTTSAAGGTASAAGGTASAVEGTASAAGGTASGDPAVQGDLCCHHRAPSGVDANNNGVHAARH